MGSSLLSTAWALGVSLLLALSSGGVPMSPASAPSPRDGVPSFGHVFLIIGENAEGTQVTPASMPYLTGTLLPQAAYLARYYAVTHHSLANYVAMTSGQYTLCERHDDAPSACHQDVGNVFQQLDTANVTWQAWMESMDVPCSLYTPTDAGPGDPYTHTHNPAIYYDNIEGPGGLWSGTSTSTECRTHVLPMGAPDVTDTSAFDAALAVGNVSRFNFIVPNVCEDGHSSCPPVSNRLLQFDLFLAREVPKILTSPAFGADGVLIITFDEGTARHFNFHDRAARGGRVFTLILSPLARPGTYETPLDHFGLLRTLEDGFRLSGYLGAASRAAPVDMIWTT